MRRWWCYGCCISDWLRCTRAWRRWNRGEGESDKSPLCLLSWSLRRRHNRLVANLLVTSLSVSGVMFFGLKPVCAMTVFLVSVGWIGILLFVIVWTTVMVLECFWIFISNLLHSMVHFGNEKYYINQGSHTVTIKKFKDFPQPSKRFLGTFSYGTTNILKVIVTIWVTECYASATCCLFWTPQ